jgi:hypothetical protein
MTYGAGARWATLTKAFCFTLFLVALISKLGGSALGQILTPADTAIPIDSDSVFVGPTNNGRFPVAENPPKILDNNPATKYLNFGGLGSGFIVTPALPLAVESFQITTANDAMQRDPTGWQLFGRNGALTTVDSGPTPAINPDGTAEAWTMIDSGTVDLPTTRLTAGPVVNVNNVGSVAYEHYKVLFPTLRGPDTAIMQIADFQFFLDDAGTPAQALLTPTDPIIGVDSIPAPPGFSGSSSPANEQAPLAIDNNHTTKYLNFGEERSGLIITNAEGPVDVNFMRLITANDAVERDPTSYELWGTNDPIQSQAHSNGNGGENWTMISSGSITLPDARFSPSNVVAVNSPANYTSYKLIFPTVKNATAANSMQISGVQFATNASQIPEPSTVALLGLGFMCAAASRRRG